MEPLTRNGGFIGATLDFASEEQYITGTVAGSVTHFDTTNGSSVNVTYPTGIQADDIIILAVAADTRDPNSYSDVNGVEFIRIYNDGTSANGSVHALRVTSGTGTYATPNNGDSMNWVCSVFRGVDPTQTLSSMFVNSTEGSGLPNPPSTGSAVSTDAMIVITGALDDDDEANWTPAAPSGFTLSGYNGGTGNNATAMMAYAQGTGVTVDPGAFTAATGSASDACEATTLVLNGGGLVTQYGNYKNSGVWDIPAVYDSLLVPPPPPPPAGPLTFKGYATFSQLNTTSGTIDLTSLSSGTLAAGDLVIVFTASSSYGDGTPNPTISSSGYTLLADSIFGNDTVDVAFTCGYKVMASTPDTGVSITGFPHHTFGLAYVFSGAQIGPFATDVGGNTGQWDSPFISLSIPSGKEAIVISAGASPDSSGYTAIAPSGYNNNVVNFGLTSALATIGTVAAAGTQLITNDETSSASPGVWTGTSTSSSVAWAAITIAVYGA